MSDIPEGMYNATPEQRLLLDTTQRSVVRLANAAPDIKAIDAMMAGLVAGIVNVMWYDKRTEADIKNVMAKLTDHYIQQMKLPPRGMSNT